MHLLSARNAHSLLPVAIDRLLQMGVPQKSRNGDVLRLEGPTLLKIEKPLERVVLWSERDCNPFFHHQEALGYLAGNDQLEFYTNYLPKMAEFSDDGKRLGASYGYRWRRHFNYDQLGKIVTALKNNPDDRRQVLAMWDGHEDLEDQAFRKDLPCNTHAYFSTQKDGSLDLTVCNRSNDLVWGLLGANVVHFSFLLEYVARKAGLPVGTQYHVTNNLHGYIATLTDKLKGLPKRQGEASLYELGIISPYRIAVSASEMDAFDRDLMNLGGQMRYESSYFKETVHPLEISHRFYKSGDFGNAIRWANTILAPDWGMACVEWLQRRQQRRMAKSNGDEVTHAKQL